MNAEIKPKKIRSPNFPVLTLEKSLSLVQTLLDKYARHATPWEVGVKTLGYSSKSSHGLQTMAALSAYGLIQTEGSGAEKKITVSDLAFKILADKRIVSAERDAAIKEAALKPHLFQKFMERYPQSLPANDALEYELVFTYKFNEGSVRDFINVFRETLSYAKVYESGIIGDKYTSPETPNQEPQGDKPMPTPQETLGPRTASLKPSTFITDVPEGEYEISRFFLGKDISVRLLASAPITKFTQKTIDKLIAHLNLDKEDLPEGNEKPKEDEYP